MVSILFMTGFVSCERRRCRASPLFAAGILGAAHTTRFRAKLSQTGPFVARNAAPNDSRVSASAAKTSSRVDDAISVIVWV